MSALTFFASLFNETTFDREELAAKKSEPIKVTLPDGTQKEGQSWRTTPLMIAEQISNGLLRTI